MDEKRERRTALGAALSETALAQLYRGELGRSDVWRTRLDTTTNWALTVSGVVVTFTFGAPQVSHVPILVGILLVITFLTLEARRYRYYDLWNRRVRLLEDGFWVPVLRREPIDPDALRELAVEMERPQLQLTISAALQTRLNRAYGALLVVLLATWAVKVYSHPVTARSWSEFIDRAHVGPVSGWVTTVALGGLAFLLGVLWLISRFARLPMGEFRPRPRPRRRSLWEAFYRPYVTATTRRAREEEAVRR